jgi:hypothetical protein
MDETTRLTVQILDPARPVNPSGTKPDSAPGTRCVRASWLR